MFLYFIQASNTTTSRIDGENSYVKIGVSGSLKKRFDNLKTGSPLELFFIGAVWFETTSEAINAERRLHYEFKDIKSNGEWFIITDRVSLVMNTLLDTFPNRKVMGEDYEMD